MAEQAADKETAFQIDPSVLLHRQRTDPVGGCPLFLDRVVQAQATLRAVIFVKAVQGAGGKPRAVPQSIVQDDLGFMVVRNRRALAMRQSQPGINSEDVSDCRT
jgi:hypothetical protein